MGNQDVKELSILYKRKGHFDSQRDKLLLEFQQSKSHKELLRKIKEIVDRIVNSQPELLMKNKGQLAALIEGTISRTQQNNTHPTNSSGNLLGRLNKESIIIQDDVDNVYDIFDEQVKQSTIGSQELKQEIRNVLKQLKLENQ